MRFIYVCFEEKQFKKIKKHNEHCDGTNVTWNKDISNEKMCKCINNCQNNAWIKGKSDGQQKNFLGDQKISPDEMPHEFLPRLMHRLAS